MKKLILQYVVVVFIVSVLSACGWFGDRVDPVVAGSLTLTPLRVPDGLSAPNENQALQVPNVDLSPLPNSGDDIAVPPPLDVDEAKAEASILLSDSGQKGDLPVLPSVLKYTTAGQGILIFKANFDLVWESIDRVIGKLGFNIDDRDRSKNTYEISRDLPKTAAQELEEKDTGVERQSGQQEKYQIYIENKLAENVDNGNDKEENSSSEEHTELTIRNPAGQFDSSNLAKHLLVQIKAIFEQPLK